MRSDMPKVLVERPRLGRSSKFRWRMREFDRKTRTRDGEDAAPKVMRMRFARSRYLNENLEPLYRFLQKRRGRKWDEVYSEIRSQVAPGSAVDMHIMDHLWQCVLFARKTRSGRTMLVGKEGEERVELLSKRCKSGCSDHGVFYVELHTGLLELACFACIAYQFRR